MNGKIVKVNQKKDLLKKTMAIYLVTILIFGVLTFMPPATAEEFLLVDSEFNLSMDSEDLRNNSASQDWYESRNDTPSLVTLDISDVAGNSGKKAALKNFGIESNAYLTQEFSVPQTSIFNVSLDININRIENNSEYKRSGIIYIGDNNVSSENPPTGTSNERFVFLTFYDPNPEDNSDDLQIKARTSSGNYNNTQAWTTVTTNLSYDIWYNIMIELNVSNGTYNVYIDGAKIGNNISKYSDYSSNSITHISIVAESDGRGDFYVDNVFAPVVDRYELDVAVVGNGSVNIDPNLPSYNYGDVVELEAYADVGWTFSHWSGSINGSMNPTTITIDSNEMVIANFSKNILPPLNNSPVFSNLSITNGTTNVSVDTSSLSIIIGDPEGDLFNWSIETSPDVGSNSGSNEYNGDKTCNISDLAYNTTYIWYVNATDPSGSGNWTNATYSFTTEEFLLPTLKWSKSTFPGDSDIGPLAADVDGDGKIEVIRTGVNGIEVFDGTTGTSLWTKSYLTIENHNTFEIIDLNKDGILEIICATNNGTLALHGNNGSVYWHNPNAPSQNKFLVTGDIDMDGFPEVFVTTIGSITGLTYDGQIFASAWTYYPCWGGLALGDTDQDGVFELYQNDRSQYYGTGEGEGVKAFWASNLTKRWSRPEILCSSHCPTLVDVDKDGKLDIVSLQQSGGGIIVLNSTDGSIINYTKNIPGMTCHSQPTIYDIDNDGNLELITVGGSHDAFEPYIWDLYDWQLDAILPYPCIEPPTVADITGDGNVEIIACTLNNITIFNNKYEVMGTIPIDDAQAYVVAQDVDDDGLTELIFNKGSNVYVYDTVAPVPNPKSLSQFSFYSQHRGRAPYYTQFEPLKPIITSEKPINGATNQIKNSTLSVYIYDYQHDTMNITFKTNATTDIWHDIESKLNVPSGTYSVSTTDMNSTGTKYWWSVSCTDGIYWTNKTYSFTTEINHSPVSSNEVPLNGSVDVPVNTNLLSSIIEDPEGDSFNWTIKTYPNIGNNSGENDNNGIKTCNISDLAYSTTYTWYVCAIDGMKWKNQTYWFTTEDDPSSYTGGYGGGSGGNPPSNNELIADANGSYNGFVGIPVLFNGSESSDDEIIESYQWDFGDNNTGAGVSAAHTYFETGNYTVKLTIFDNDGKTDTDTTYVIISNTTNNTPGKPILEGVKNGNKNISYLYSVKSTDDDNQIKYVINWGDETSTISDFMETNTVFETTHNWKNSGIYSVTAYAKDENNAASEIVKMTVLIDSHYVENIGYLLDDDGDETYDSFHDNATGIETDVEKQSNGRYLIDKDGDGKWDYTYVPDTGEIKLYESDKSELSQQAEDNIVVVILAISLIIFTLILLIVRRRIKKID